MRTIIELPDDQIGALAAICRRRSISRAEAIRQAVAHLVQREGRGAASEAFGLWRDRRLDSLQYEESLRREWDER